MPGAPPMGVPGAPPPEEAGPVFGPEHKKALISLLDQYELEDQSTRLSDIRRIRKAREFWKGDQYLWFSEVEQHWRTLSSSFGVENQKDLEDIYQYVTNIYQGYGLTFMSVVSQNAPTVRFWPQSPKDPDDIATAEAASDVSELINRNNNMDARLVDEGFYLWCDGMFGGYVRYVTDAERFGSTKTPIMGTQQVQITPDALMCPCGWSNELPEGAANALPPATPCANCGNMLTAENLKQGEMAELPTFEGHEVTPNGQEIIDIVGKLELRIPSYCKELVEAPYLSYSAEIPKAKVVEIYPDSEKDLTDAGSGPGDTEERRARMNLKSDVRSGNPANQGETLLTVKRVWFRPWAINLLKDKKLVQDLKTLFPAGVHFVSTGKTVLEGRAESMDDHWRICFAYPGDGSIRPSVGGSLMSVQERYNTLSNIEVETHEHGIPTLFVDEEAINLKAWQEEGNTPGLTFPVRSRAGLPIQAQLFQTDPAPVSPQLVAHREELMGPVAQFLTGLFPALFGGGAIGNDTAAGYAMQRDQAMGRIGLLWRNMKFFHAELMELAVKCFASSRTHDVEMASLTQLGDVDWKVIHLDQLTGGFFAYPETNEDFPMSWTQKRNSFEGLLNSPLVNLLQTPPNMDALSRVMGPLGLQFPGADARTQQFREVSDLMQSAPMTVPGPDGVTPMNTQATISVDPDLDDHAVHMQAIQEWAASAAGRQARSTNPQGFLNVKLHFREHQMALSQQQMAAAQAQAATQPAPDQESGPGEPTPQQ